MSHALDQGEGAADRRSGRCLDPGRVRPVRHGPDHVGLKRHVYTQPVPNVAAAGSSPWEILSEQEVGALLRAALAHLLPKQRIVVILRYYEGLNYAEIASALQTLVKAVERLLSR